MASHTNSSSSSKAKIEEKEEEGGVTEALVAVGAVVVGVAAVASWGLSKLFGDSGEKTKKAPEKMMKAPGQEYYMPRKDFVSNPAEYFRNHRN